MFCTVVRLASFRRGMIPQDLVQDRQSAVMSQAKTNLAQTSPKLFRN